MNGEQMYARLLQLDETIVRNTAHLGEGAAFQPLSPFWRESFKDFLLSDCRRLIARVGRQGRKSSSCCLFSVAMAAYGEFNIAPGNLGIVAIVSVRMSDAKERLRTIEAILDAARIPHHPIKDEEIILKNRPIAFRVYPASIGGVSGFTSVFVLLDEVSKWKDVQTGANPAEEVLKSIMPTMITQRNARMMIVSSPMSTVDLHFSLVKQGNTPNQRVIEAPTWTANPEMTKEHCRRESFGDENYFLREFAAIPQSSETSVFSAADIERAMQPRHLEGWSSGEKNLILDPSSNRGGSAFTACAVSWYFDERGKYWKRPDGSLVMRDGEPVILDTFVETNRVLVFQDMHVLSGSLYDVGNSIVDQIKTLARKNETSTVRMDQRSGDALSELLRSQGSLRPLEHSWSATTKGPAIDKLCRLLQEGAVALPNDDALRRELMSFNATIQPTGSTTYGAGRGMRDDRVALLITAMMSDLPESPRRRGGVRQMMGTTRLGMFC